MEAARLMSTGAARCSRPNLSAQSESQSALTRAQIERICATIWRQSHSLLGDGIKATTPTATLMI